MIHLIIEDISSLSAIIWFLSFIFLIIPLLSLVLLKLKECLMNMKQNMIDKNTKDNEKKNSAK